MSPMPLRKRRWLICAALLLGCLAVFGQTLRHDFSAYDDRVHITQNPFVRAGFGAEGLRWALTTFHGSNWHPLTWTSFMVDASIGGMRPWAFHATNIVLHSASALLLFLILEDMTRRTARSAFVAALFALHPLHVESVAWVSERKDVLSGLFFFLTIAAWIRYVRAPAPGRYALVAVAFALGLMCKPMLVTLPLILLLLDIWPLERLRPGPDGDRAGPGAGVAWLVLEKVPLLVAAAASGVVTVLAQRGGGALASLAHQPIEDRLLNAIDAAATYMGRAVWPVRLAVFYPHPGSSIPLPKVALSAAILVVVTAFAIGARRRFPALMAGWAWYLITLLPVLGLIQVGMQASADRYTYLPLVGLFIAAIWAAADLTSARAAGETGGPAGRAAAEPHAAGLHRAGLPGPRAAGPSWSSVHRRALVLAGTAIVALLAACSFVQARYWRDDARLFARAIEVTGPNAVAHTLLGGVLRDRGDLASARHHLEEAIRISPRYAAARADLAGILLLEDDLPGAVAQCRQALALWPAHPAALTNLGLAVLRQGDPDEAASLLEAAIAARPFHAPAHVNLGLARRQQGRLDEAAASFREALRIDPANVHAYINLGVALARLGRLDEAEASFLAALRADPRNETARTNLEALRRARPAPHR